MPNDTIWTKMSSAPPAAFFSSASRTGIQFQLSAGTGTRLQGTITWYLANASTSAFLEECGVSATSEGTTFTYGAAPSLPPGYSWYSVSLTPLTWNSTTKTDMTDRVIGAGGTFSSSTANTTLKNELWLAYTKSDNDVRILSTSNGTTWSSLASPTSTGALADSAPSLAITDSQSTGALYLAYREHSSSSKNIHVRWSSDGSRFSSSLNTTLDSNHAPALASLSGKLYMAYRDAKSSDALYVVQPADPQSSSSWSGASRHSVATSVSGDPSMVAFGGKLFLAIRGSSGTVEVYQSSDGSTWSQAATIYEDLRDPSIGCYNGFLYIACRDASNAVWICSSPDGSSWSGFSELTAELPTVTTTVAPALCPASSTALVLAWVDTSSSGDNLHSYTAT
jgi:hypothetical protein